MVRGRPMISQHNVFDSFRMRVVLSDSSLPPVHSEDRAYSSGPQRQGKGGQS